MKLMRRPAAFVLVCLVAGSVLAAASLVVKFPAKAVQGTGPLPYNYRVIDGHIHAGGHPLNPATEFSNTDEQALSILNYLKSKGVTEVIDLENTKNIKARYQVLLDKAGLKLLHIPLSSFRVPDKKEWAAIKSAMKGKVYVHCKWGADRTGMVIARYLVENAGYTPDQAYRAVISGGTHAGTLGGFNTGLGNFLLKRFIYTGPR